MKRNAFLNKFLIFFPTFFLLFQISLSPSSNLTLFLLTNNKGILVSFDNGNSWKNLNDGLPGKIIPIKLYKSPTNIYLTTFRSGIFRLSRGNTTWRNISSPSFKLRSKYNNGSQYRKISAFSINESNPDHLVLATKHTIYSSYNSGNSWKKISMKGLHSRNYITALAVKGNIILAGTSFNGVFELKNGRFIKRNNGLPKEPYSGKLAFYEEISHIKFSKTKGIYVGTGFGKGVYYLYSLNEKWKDIKLPVKKDSFKLIYDINVNNKSIFISSGNRGYKFNKHLKSWYSISFNQYLNNISRSIKATGLYVDDNSGNNPSLFYNLKSQNTKQISSDYANKKAIYANIYQARKNLDKLILTIKNSKLNAIVIDMKDDSGNIFFPTNNDIAHKIKSARKPENISKILDKLHSNKIYVIARIVVFKDKKLFDAYNNRYTIKNRNTGLPWKGNPREHWVDPFSEFVHNYNIAIAVELEELGFDEIQFDYIRFPSDGQTSLCKYTFKYDKNTYKSETLSDFLITAKEKLSIPISTDIYGFNSWYHFGNWIGQDMEEFSTIVDVISPMVYPSHFGKQFYMKGPRNKRPFRIVHDGGVRAVILSSTVIRPYLQAFNMMSPTWGPEYIKNQVLGANISGCSGYIFWNASGNYKVVKQALGN